MARSVRLIDLKVAIGAVVSNTIDMAVNYGGMGDVFLIQAPGVLDAGTYTIETSADGITFAKLTSDGTAAVTLPIAGNSKAFYFELHAAPFWRIRSPIAAAADRIFMLSIQESDGV